MLNVGNLGHYVISLSYIALSHVHEQNYGITDLSHFSACSLGHLHRKIFHVECWEFRPLCDNSSYPSSNVICP